MAMEEEEDAWASEEEEDGMAAAVARRRDKIFNCLMQECEHCAPGARLSARLRAQLEGLPPESRAALVSRRQGGATPLLVASRRGCSEVAEYLVRVCGAPLEQRGVFCAPAERARHRVTPLWAAAVAGHAKTVKMLAACGAEIDAASDSGSTPLRSACFMSHEDVVRFLLERGADHRAVNHHGGTCLINSVQSPRLCALLLDHGAEVDAVDAQQKSALHYAVVEQRVASARVLLARGAGAGGAGGEGDTPLRLACLKGATQIVSLLCSTVQYSTAELVDAYELLGATQLDEFNDLHACLAAWEHATILRHATPVYLAKRRAPPPA